VDAINIEWNTAPEFEVDPHFAEQVLRMAGRKDRAVILICHSGKRSIDVGLRSRSMASRTSATCSRASKASSTPIITRGTLGGWRKHGLPWRQV
jgi:rhodanese-related sulfurtransferase